MTADTLQDLVRTLPGLDVDTTAHTRAAYASDQGPVLEYTIPAAVVRAGTVAEVQQVLRWASRTGTAVVARGAGSGVSGGAHATPGCIVLSLERMNRILEIRPDDELARVEPGVINETLNTAAAEYGLMYAPDPASYRISTIGGNVATNAGGLRCAKYGVTRDSVLSLDVVLADGTLITTGRQTFKGVAGYDLTGLFTGSEGTLGIVVGITVRLRYLPVRVCTLAGFFPDLDSAAAGVLAVGRARVQPSIMELLDGETMAALDAVHGSDLRSRGETLLLIQTDGYGADAEAEVVRSVLAGLGGTVSLEGSEEALRLVDLRRHSRGDAVHTQLRVGEDVAVPRSRLVSYIGELHRMARRHDVRLKVVAHAGDGNLHPTFWVETAQGSAAAARLDAALDESISVALAMGGTITGEHGIGQFKLRWLAQEQPPELRELQRRIKAVFDPAGILNPGKGIVGAEDIGRPAG